MISVFDNKHSYECDMLSMNDGKINRYNANIDFDTLTASQEGTSIDLKNMKMAFDIKNKVLLIKDKK